MSEHYVRILVQMASAFGWPVRVLYWYAKYTLVVSEVIKIVK
jgi:hypothetical protein